MIVGILTFSRLEPFVLFLRRSNLWSYISAVCRGKRTAFEVNIKVVMSLKLMTSTRVGKMEGSHFEGSPSPVNYSHAARCLLHLPLRRSQSTNENARRARQTEATQPLEGRWARLGGFALIREWFIWSCSVHNKVFERGYAGLCPASL